MHNLASLWNKKDSLIFLMIVVFTTSLIVGAVIYKQGGVNYCVLNEKYLQSCDRTFNSAKFGVKMESKVYRDLCQCCNNKKSYEDFMNNSKK